LTTIVSVDPVYAYFDMAENVFQRIQQRVREGKIKYVEADKLLVFLGLSTETGFPHEGAIDFADNRIDPNTGTLRIRGVFPNPKPETGGRVLMPGMFARVRVPIGDPRPMMLVPEQALGTDQGQKFVYVVNAKNEVEYRRVTVGKLEGELRAIDEGLRAEDLVIVRGVQRVRPGMPVKPNLEQ
jgi:RND family efflux transporter MFP subunit